MNKANTAEGTNQANHVSGLDCASAQSALSLSLSLSLSVSVPLTEVLTAYFCKQPPLSLMDKAACFYFATQQLTLKTTDIR